MPSIVTRTAGAVPTNPSTNAPSILALTGFFCVFTIIVVLLRIYVRVKILKTLGVDDYLITAATICGLGVFICFNGETRHGVGRHTKDVNPAELTKLFHWNYFHSLIVTLGISLVKLSVANFLLRLVPGKGYKIFLKCTIVFLIAFTLSSEGTIAFSCIPIRATWDPLNEPHAKCFSNKTFTAIGLFNSAVNIVTDVLFASMPIPMVWKLQVNMRTKLSLIFVLSLGYFACAASIVKTYIQSHFFTDPDYLYHDSYAVWNSIELYMGILAASLPSLRPLLRSILDTTRRITTNVGGPRHRYYVQEDNNVGMNNLSTSKSRKSIAESGKSPYRVTITSGNHSASKSEEEMNKPDGSIGSKASWPLPIQGITKQTDVVVY